MSHQNANIENPNANMPGDPPKTPQKKNRILQYYKFIFYSMKFEIKLHEFIRLIQFSNQAEIVLWVLSVLLYVNTPKELRLLTHDGEEEQSDNNITKYPGILIWIHLLHIIRGILGNFLVGKLPLSYSVLQEMKIIPENELETKIFNDIARDILNKTMITPVKAKKWMLFLYFILTIINFFVDAFDFALTLKIISHGIDNNTMETILLTYFAIAVLYLAVDLSYMLWIPSLRYVFPPSFVSAMGDAFTGTIWKAILRFKIGKPATDIHKEAKEQGVPKEKNVDMNDLKIEIGNSKQMEENKSQKFDNNLQYGKVSSLGGN